MTLMMMNLSILFVLSKHPISLSIIIFLQTILMALYMGSNFNYWLSYILFIVMIGGLLILFLYMTNVASNEKFNNPINMKSMLIIMVTSTTLLTLKKYLFMYMYSMNTKTLEMSMMKFYQFPLSMILIMIMLFLLFTMIMVVKLTNVSKGPLRQKS